MSPVTCPPSPTFPTSEVNCFAPRHSGHPEKTQSGRHSLGANAGEGRASEIEFQKRMTWTADGPPSSSIELGIPAAAHVIRHLPSFTDVPDERGELIRPGTQISQRRRHELERETSPSARTPAKEGQANIKAQMTWTAGGT